MSLRRLSLTELIAVVGGVILAIGLFLPWYELANERTMINERPGPGTRTGWEVHDIQRWIWIITAVAPLVLAYIVVRGHKLSWARGELTAVLGMAGLVLILFDGLLKRPGEPMGLVDLQVGWFVALVGLVLVLAGSALRATMGGDRPRKPPGTL